MNRMWIFVRSISKSGQLTRCWPAVAVTLTMWTALGGSGGAVLAAEPPSLPPGLTAEFLRNAVEDIKQTRTGPAAAGGGDRTEAFDLGQQAAPRAARRLAGASDTAGQEATSVEIVSGPLPRSTPKMAAEEGSGTSVGAQAARPELRLSFSSGSFSPDPGVDPRLQATVQSEAALGPAAVDPFTYGFVLTTEYPSREMAAELHAIGVELLGEHGDAVKIKLPRDSKVLQRLAATPYVHWVGYSQPEQKIDATLKAVLHSFAGTVEEFPLIIALFEDDADGRFARRLQQLGIVLGQYDPQLQIYRAVASSAEIRAMIELDFVLFIEVERPAGPSHDQSMATMGVDYIRPGGLGERFGGDSTIVGILDTGFMLGAAAAVPHADLNKFGCGRNFTTDATDVWNDENGHGTHVLGTLVGTGTADPRYRGVAPGVGETADTQIRAAKIWKRDGDNDSSWMESAIDFMADGSDCDSAIPLVINISGGTAGAGQTGTDSTSRKLDAAVWTNRQAYVVAAGNDGPAAGTIRSPGVAKNALTVGNVLDNGYQTVGDLYVNPNGPSSIGPTGDGRMKPNVVATGSVVTSARAGTADQYIAMSGTSMATPHVTGIAATLLEHLPDFQGRPDLLRAQLMATSLLHDDTTTPSDNSLGGRNDYGLGRVSDYVAHWAHSNDNGWTVSRVGSTVTDRNWAYFDLTVPEGAQRLVAVMTWDEPAADDGAAQAVIYDLDLWADYQADCMPNDKGECGEWTSQSYVDNTEYLIINQPPPGKYRLKIINWHAPSFGLPASIAALVVRGNPTPAMTLTATPSRVDPPVGSTFTVTTSVFSPSYESSGVHLALTSSSGSLRLIGVRTTREDGVDMDFQKAIQLTLGNTIERDTRSAVWTFQVLWPGSAELDFRAWSENGGQPTAIVNLAPRTS